MGLYRAIVKGLFGDDPDAPDAAETEEPAEPALSPKEREKLEVVTCA